MAIRTIKPLGWDQLPAALQPLVVDFASTAGPTIAIRALQTVLGVQPTGTLTPETLQAVAQVDPAAVQQALVVERVRLIARVVAKTPRLARELPEWIERALAFLPR